MYNLVCSHCSIKYTTKWAPKNRGRNYCSRSCALRYNPRRHLEGKCAKCETVITVANKFCVECRKEYQESLKTSTLAKRKASVTKSVSRRAKQLKQMAIDYKGGSCNTCGYNKCVGALHFHHENPSTKLFSISGKTFSWKRIQSELDKCLLLCANCHAEAEEKLRSYR